MAKIKKVFIEIDGDDPNLSEKFRKAARKYEGHFVALMSQCAGFYGSLGADKEKFQEFIDQHLGSPSNDDLIMDLTKDEIVELSIEFYEIVTGKIKSVEEGNDDPNVTIEDVGPDDLDDLIERTGNILPGVDSLLDEDTISNEN